MTNHADQTENTSAANDGPIIQEKNVDARPSHNDSRKPNQGRTASGSNRTMMRFTRYFVIKVTIAAPRAMDECDRGAAVDNVVHECDYRVGYEDPDTGIKIVDTELIGAADAPPIDLD